MKLLKRRRLPSGFTEQKSDEPIEMPPELFKLELMPWGQSMPFPSVEWVRSNKKRKKNQKRRRIFPLPENTEYRVRVTVTAKAFEKIWPDKYFGLDLSIDGEQVQFWFCKQSEYDWKNFRSSDKDADSIYIFNGIHSRRFKTCMRNDPTNGASERSQLHTSVGTVEISFYHARQKPHTRKVRSLINAGRFGQDRERKLKMTRDEKMYTSVLQTTEGDLYQHEQKNGRSVGVAPAYRIEKKEPLDTCRIYYDTPDNLAHRAILRPMKIRAHRSFFPQKDWIAEQRKINRNLQKLQSSKIRTFADLTDDGNKNPRFVEQELRLKRYEPIIIDDEIKMDLVESKEEFDEKYLRGEGVTEEEAISIIMDNDSVGAESENSVPGVPNKWESVVDPAEAEMDDEGWSVVIDERPEPDEESSSDSCLPQTAPGSPRSGTTLTTQDTGNRTKSTSTGKRRTASSKRSLDKSPTYKSPQSPKYSSMVGGPSPPRSSNRSPKHAFSGRFAPSPPSSNISTAKQSLESDIDPSTGEPHVQSL